jgi:serine phosphatase RsbU (regulator of sigma subunit)/FixJ family two-component response regulator
MTEEAARILLVDDDLAKRYVIGTWLRRAGHEVTEVGTGAEALAMTPAAELVMLDVNLPDMTGFDVCRMIKANPATASIPVIQVSATAIEAADRAHGLTQGADAYLIDPAEPQELLATVTAVLRYSRARRRAERTAWMLTAMTDVTMRINAATTFDGLARAAAVGAARIFGTAVVLIVVQPDGQLRRTSATPDQPVAAQRGGPVETAAIAAARILGPSDVSGVVQMTAEEYLSLVPDSTIRSDVSVAMARTKPDRPPVGLVIDTNGVPGPEEMQIQRQLVQSVALAVEALRSYAEEHLVALTLQRSFLPATLPTVAGLALSVRYIPASNQAEIGGDFYEALTWQDKLLVAIGDVQGHSLHAAIVMGELRHALRAFATESHLPVDMTRLVNRVLQQYHPGIIATLCLAVVDPVTGDAELVNCGHIPPLIAADGKAAWASHGGLMLGLPFDEPHRQQAVLPPGGTLLLVTDGLIEERTVLLDDNMEKLRLAAAAASEAPIEAFTNQLMSLFGPREDDVAMIAIRRAD